MTEFVASESMMEYFNNLENKLNHEIQIAGKARSHGKDPSSNVEIPVAKDLADRVENLIGVPGVAERIRELENDKSREEAALSLGKEVAEGYVGNFESKKDSVESAIRVAVAMLTEGVVAAPIEGIDSVNLAKNDDGTEYISIFYAGPVRSAGGTAQALSVLVGDYVRRGLNIDRYKPRKEEVERYVEEITLYRRVAGLQYMPSEEEIRLIVENCPICLDGEPTEQAEVEGYRDLERVGTNRIRGGVGLVLAEGIALKAPKIQKYVKKYDIDGWEWLDTLMSGEKSEKKDDSGGTEESGDTKKSEKKPKPKDKYLRDLIAGRPVFSHPSRPGGFRLRYGRSRNTSFASAGINPASMVIMDKFIVAGTQLKVEIPGKAMGMAPVDFIEGPTVRLKSGDVLRIDDVNEAYELYPQVEQIIDIGEMLINYGDFLENNHPLVPSPYCFEWWIQEYRNTVSDTRTDEELEDLTQDDALRICDQYNVPLHPKFTYLWHDIPPQEFGNLARFVSEHGKVSDDNSVLQLPYNAAVDDGIKLILEKLLLFHNVRDGMILISEPLPFIRSLGLGSRLELKWGDIDFDDEDAQNAVNNVSGLVVRDRSLTRVGARMGRPEKSNRRKMSPVPNVLFPIGESGGNTRQLDDASNYKATMNSKVGEIKVEIGTRECQSCGIETYECRCDCGEFTVPKMSCPWCDIKANDGVCPKCGARASSVKTKNINFKNIYQKAFENLGERDNFESFKGVKRLMSKNMTPEPIEKGVLRAKYNLYTFKDATVRYDMSDIPLTHIRPDELGVTASQLRELGYTEDIYGKPFTEDDQIVCLKVQDLVVPYDAADYLLKTAQYIDDLLVKYYGLEPYYNAKSIDDIVGVLLMGLAPHTSAGVLGRLVGFTKASVGFAHPFFHAAKRRNCDGDEDCVMLLMDGLINFSPEYLPDKRGGKMDAPLVLTTRIDPNEVDKEAHNIDVCPRYPLEFYESTLNFTNPKDFEDTMDIVNNRLGTPQQYDNFLFTHDTTDIAAGPKISAYKTFGSMLEKVESQLELADKIRAVDASDVAERVLMSHFLPDLIGNLRAFSRQGTRCVKCGEKFRRPPLSGSCTRCGGKVILTVHEGAVKKYLDISSKVANDYNVSEYTKQRIEIIGYEIKSLFENDKSKQIGLSDFM